MTTQSKMHNLTRSLLFTNKKDHGQIYSSDFANLYLTGSLKCMATCACNCASNNGIIGFFIKLLYYRCANMYTVNIHDYMHTLHNVVFAYISTCK